ncbi:MAG TPA: metallophosphoesterase [Bacteroidota bacterium]|nr:metallophosphoesterase [Bacteroidota bacterium]
MRTTERLSRTSADAGSLAQPEVLHPRRSGPTGIAAGSTRATGNSFTIAHLSDPHLSRQYYREHIKSLKILLRSILDEGCDHILITGDIVSTGDPDDYYLARKILTTYGLMDSRKLTIVPGNHDIFGGPHRAVDVLSFPRHIRTIDYHRRVALFQEAFAETFEGVERMDGDTLFPFIKRVGPFSILGLNSIPPWSLWDNPLGSNGMLSESQFAALSRLNDEGGLGGGVPIVAIHHHFNDLVDETTENSLWRKIESKTMRMKRRKKLLRIFSSLGVRGVLHGHVHRNELYEKNGIHLANGAGAVCDDPVNMLKYNRVTSAGTEVGIEIRLLPIAFQTSVTAVSFHQFHSVGSVPQAAAS